MLGVFKILSRVCWKFPQWGGEGPRAQLEVRVSGFETLHLHLVMVWPSAN